MEPKLPTPNLGSERIPAYHNQSREYSPGNITPEKTIERGNEQLERRNETTSPTPVAMPAIPSVALPTVAPPVPEPAATPIASDMPLVANDDDLIEKEWVDKAKKNNRRN